jgi:hypothetical protein
MEKKQSYSTKREYETIKGYYEKMESYIKNNKEH